MKKIPNKQHKTAASLDRTEREIERSLERGDYAPVSGRSGELTRARAAARNTVAKNRSINIRISERDLARLRAAAMREGIPYQTYVASLIHKAVR